MSRNAALDAGRRPGFGGGGFITSGSLGPLGDEGGRQASRLEPGGPRFPRRSAGCPTDGFAWGRLRGREASRTFVTCSRSYPAAVIGFDIRSRT